MPINVHNDAILFHINTKIRYLNSAMDGPKPE